MTYGPDDADSDDEYGDLKVVLYDVTARTAAVTNLALPSQVGCSWMTEDGCGPRTTGPDVRAV